MRLWFWKHAFSALDALWYAVDGARNYAYNKICSSPQWQKEWQEQTEREMKELGLDGPRPPPTRI